jgi:hypothetical protein
MVKISNAGSNFMVAPNDRSTSNLSNFSEQNPPIKVIKTSKAAGGVKLSNKENIKHTSGIIKLSQAVSSTKGSSSKTRVKSTVAA